jgi:hypothetical protein
VTGYIVADKIEDDPAVGKMIQDMANSEMFAMAWKTLLDIASRHWAEFFEAVVERSPDDPRVQNLREQVNGDSVSPAAAEADKAQAA